MPEPTTDIVDQALAHAEATAMDDGSSEETEVTAIITPPTTRITDSMVGGSSTRQACPESVSSSVLPNLPGSACSPAPPNLNFLDLEEIFRAETNSASKAAVLFAYLKRKQPFHAPRLEDNWNSLLQMRDQSSQRAAKVREEISCEISEHVIQIVRREYLFDPRNPCVTIPDKSLKRALNYVKVFHENQTIKIVEKVLDPNLTYSYENFFAVQQEKELALAERAHSQTVSTVPILANSKHDYKGVEERYILNPPLIFLLSFSPKMKGKWTKLIFSLQEIKEYFLSYLETRPELTDCQSGTILCEEDVLGLVIGLRAFDICQLETVLAPLIRRVDD